jgi:hypothetical protein
MSTSQKQKTHTGYYPNLRACAAAEDVKVEVLKLAKSLNCPGFKARGGVDWNQASKWMAEHGKELEEKAANSKAALEIRKLTGQCERIEYDNQVARNKFYSKAEVNSTLKAIAERQKTMLLSKLRNELAPKLKGLDDVQRIDVLEACGIEICEIFSRGVLKYQQ